MTAFKERGHSHEPNLATEQLQQQQQQKFPYHQNIDIHPKHAMLYPPIVVKTDMHYKMCVTRTKTYAMVGIASQRLRMQNPCFKV